MEKTWNYLFIISGMMLVFYFTGLSTSSGTMLSFMLNLQNVNTTTWWLTVVGLLSGTSAATILIGFVSKNVELALVAPLALFLLISGWDIIKIFIFLASLNYVLATLFLGPFLLMYIMIIVEYWRGRDT